MRRGALIALAGLALAMLAPSSGASAKEISRCAAASYHPADQPPFGGEAVPPLHPVSPLATPAGFDLSASQAIRVAAQTDPAREALASAPQATNRVYTQGGCRWQVSFFEGDSEIARVAIDDRTGSVLEAWQGHQVGTELARGYEGAIAQKVNAPYVWIPLCVLFILPFFDPRAPRRLVHLDLLAIAGLSASLYFFNRAQITASVALTYPVLAYVLLRTLWLGLRQRAERGPLIPYVPMRWLAVGIVVLALGRIALNVVDSHVIDVGVAGVVGADRIEHGQPLYEGAFSPGLDLRGDVYGPANYLAYVPFEAVLPWDGTWGSVPAAHAASIAFDLLTAAGLLLLGRRLLPREGWSLGLALSWAWLACPWTLYAMNANANDSLVAALLVGAMLALTSAPARGALVALAAAAKFGPAALAPLFAVGTSERRARSAVAFAIAFALVALVVFVPFIPDGGIGDLYDRTLGYQANRSSPFSVWGMAPSIHFLQSVTRVAAVALAVCVAFFPVRKRAVQVAALAAAVTVGVQLGATHWFYFYVVWFLPLYLAAVFGTYRAVSRGLFASA
jgi:Glycosyltransferase family 87